MCTLPTLFIELFGGTTTQILIQTQQKCTQMMYIYTSLTMSNYMGFSILVSEKQQKWAPKILSILYSAYYIEIVVVLRHNSINAYPNSTQMHTDHVYIYIINYVKLEVSC